VKPCAPSCLLELPGRCSVDAHGDLVPSSVGWHGPNRSDTPLAFARPALLKPGTLGGQGVPGCGLLLGRCGVPGVPRVAALLVRPDYLEGVEVVALVESARVSKVLAIPRPIQALQHADVALEQSVDPLTIFELGSLGLRRTETANPHRHRGKRVELACHAVGRCRRRTPT